MGANKTGEGRVGRGLTDWLYVDVDGTLLIWPTTPGGPTKEEREHANARFRAWESGDHLYWKYDLNKIPKVNIELVHRINQWLLRRKLKGAEAKVAIWSVGGARHAKLAYGLCFQMSGGALNMQFTDEDFVFLAKPDLMIDDGARHLMAKHPVVLPEEFVA